MTDPRAAPIEAIRFFLAKGIQPGFAYDDIFGEEHLRAFTAAKFMREDVLELVQESLDGALEEGLDYRSWVALLEPRLQAAGFWGAQQVTDPFSGAVADIDVPSRLRLIYETNTRTAMAAGQYERVQRTKRSHPYLLYQLGPSRVHRPEHVRWAGLLLPVDDPFWATHYPPNGYGCKCHVRQVSRYEYDELVAAAESGGPQSARIKTARPRIRRRKWRSKRTGEEYLVPVGIDPGFDHPPNRSLTRR